MQLIHRHIYIHSFLKSFLQDHCETNTIVTTEQAVGKRVVWGYVQSTSVF